jgi:hypothetical protein
MRGWNGSKTALLLMTGALGACQPAAQGNDDGAPQGSSFVPEGALGSASAEHTHGERPRSGTSATVLASTERDEVTKIRVSAHVGSVTVRKERGEWVLAGQPGCAVAPARVQEALDNLVGLESTPSDDPLPPGTRFELQIDVLAEERQMVHFEVASRNAAGDLVRLRDDSTVRLKGLDRALWTTEREAWCKG